MLESVAPILLFFSGVMAVPVVAILVGRWRARKAEEASRFVLLKDMNLGADSVRVGSKLIVLHGPGQGHYRYVRSVNGEIVELDSGWDIPLGGTSEVLVVDPIEVQGRG